MEHHFAHAAPSTKPDPIPMISSSSLCGLLRAGSTYIQSQSRTRIDFGASLKRLGAFFFSRQCGPTLCRATVILDRLRIVTEIKCLPKLGRRIGHILHEEPDVRDIGGSGTATRRPAPPPATSKANRNAEGYHRAVPPSIWRLLRWSSTSTSPTQ